MAVCELVDANERHLADMITAGLREEDRREVELATGEEPNFALIDSYRASIRAWSILLDGRAIAMFGGVSRSLLSHTGIAWMLGCDDIVKVRVGVAKGTYLAINEGLGIFRRLENYVLDTNEISKKWLRWNGFTIEEPRPYGVSQAMFCHFYRDRG